MKFNGNPSIDLGLDYHTFSETERDGKVVVRYTLSSPVSSEKEAELSKYENVKLVRGGASHRYAPEIKYDVLYVAEDPEGGEVEEEAEGNPTAEYLRADEDLDENEVMGRLDLEIMGPEEDLSRYASITSAMSEVNSLIFLYKSLANQFPSDKPLFDNLTAECEVQLGKLSSLVNSEEIASNMAKGLAEGEALIEGDPVDESFSDEHLGDKD